MIQVASLHERVLSESVVGKSPGELGPRFFSEKFCAVVLRGGWKKTVCNPLASSPANPTMTLSTRWRSGLSLGRSDGAASY